MQSGCICWMCADGMGAAVVSCCAVLGGHVFCFACILHYLSLGSHAWSR